MLPKIIHHIVGPNTNAVTDHCLRSWRVLKKKGFKIKIWDDASIEKFLLKKYAFSLPAFINARNHAEAADIARYLIIYHFGGYYLDWDIELLSISKFLELHQDCKKGFLIKDPLNQSIASEAFSAQPGEKYLLGLVENITIIYNNGFRDTMGTPQYSGPFRMREVYYFMKKKTRQTIVEVKDVFLYDYTEIRERPPRDTEVAMIHYWMHSWLT